MRGILLFLLGLTGFIVWGIYALEPFILTRSGVFFSFFSSLHSLVIIFLQTLLLFLQGTILFQILQKTQRTFNKNWALLCLLLFLAHPFAGESIAFQFQAPEMIGNTFFFLALLFAIQGLPFCLTLLCYTLSLCFTPAGWFFPFLVLMLPRRPPFWWISFGTLGLWLFGIFSPTPFYSVSWEPFDFPQVAHLFYPRGPSFPVTSPSDPVGFFFFLGILLLGIAGGYRRKNPSSFFPASLLFSGFLCCGSLTLPGPFLNTEPWLLGFPCGLLLLWSLLWTLGLYVPRRQSMWVLSVGFILFWVSLQAFLLPAIQRPEDWLKARARVSHKKEDWLRLAQFYEGRAHYQQALEILQEAIQYGHDVRLEQLKYLAHTQKKEERFQLATDWIHSDTPHPYPYQVLGEMALEQGKWEEAHRFFESAEQLQPDEKQYSADFFLAYGQALLELGQTSKAKIRLEKAYFSDPESRTLWLNLARLYLQEENRADALFFLRKGIFGNARQENSFFQKEMLSGNGKIFVLKYIDLLTYHGHRKTALQVLREAQKKGPDEKMFLFYEALLLETPPLSVLRNAQDLYRLVLEKDPSHPESRRRLSEILFREGSFYLQENLLNIASRTLEESLKWNASNQASQQLLSKAYAQQYEMAVKQKKPSKMILFLEKSLQINPSQIDKRLTLGEIYRRKQWYEMAIKQYEAALILDPNRQEAQENLGLILWKKGVELQESAPQEAQKALKRFLTLTLPNTLDDKKNQVRLLFFELNLRLGDDAFLKGNDEVARQFFLEILEIDETNGPAFCRLADIYLSLNQKTEAISFLEKGIPLLTDPLDISNYQGILDTLRAQK